MLKTEIVSELGESPLLLPAYVERALQANNRIKYLFTLLQEARRYADNPEDGAGDLRAERDAADIDDASLDSVVPGSRRTTEGVYFIPRVAELHAQMVDALQAMLAPVRIGAGDSAATGYEQRLQALLAGLPPLSGDEVPGAYIDGVTRARHGGEDSLHLLVMDLHKQINGLQAGLAQETIDGARVYAVGEADRSLVKAFMEGLNSTAPLKFDHPGLDTTATRSGERLIIENDIGTTDAHVLVIHVRGLEVILTYTDIHQRRAMFFESLFEQYRVDWQDTRTRDLEGSAGKERYFLCVGRYAAADQKQLLDYLAFLGSRVVFLIDWNKARKRLRNFVSKNDCLDVLKWAADNNYGHRAFLQIGGERIIYEALGQLSRTEANYGDRLDEMLGRERACDYLRFALQAASAGLLGGRSDRLIRDEIKAEIFNYFQSAQEGIYELCADHAAAVYDIAGVVRDLMHGGAPDREQAARTAVLAKRWETQADELLNRVREVTRRSGSGQRLRNMTEQADDVVDSLEEAAYLLTLLPEPLPASFSRPLGNLADMVVEGARGYVRCIETARQLEANNLREDRQGFLEAVDDILTVEHRTDDGERRMFAAMIEENADNRQMHVLTRLTQSFEEAADALARSVLILKDYVLDEVITA